MGEIGQVAAIAGYFGIPVIMLAGDEAACAEVRELQPKAVTIAVKRLAGKASTSSLSTRGGKRLIREGTLAAVTTFVNTRRGNWPVRGDGRIQYWPQPPQQPTARVASYKGATVLEA